MAKAKRVVEVFSACCPLCKEAVETVRRLACPDCEVVVHNLLDDDEALGRARGLGVNAVPAVFVDGQIAECCARGAVNEETLKAAGVGRPLD